MTTTPAATLVVVVPLTNDDCLGQNARCNHFDKAKQAKALRAAAKLATVSRINGGARFAVPAEGSIALHWTIFLGKGRKLRDADNAYSVLKHCQDGMCEALGIDDKRIMLRGVVQCLTTARQSEAQAELTAGGTS